VKAVGTGSPTPRPPRPAELEGDPAPPDRPGGDAQAPVAAPPAARSRAEVWHGYAVRAHGAANDLRARMPRLVAVLRAAYYPVAVALVVWMGIDAARALQHDHVNWAAVAGSFLAALVWWLSLVYGWANLVTERFDHRQAGPWCRTQVTRYLPGGIWAPLARTTIVRGRIRDKLAAVAAENTIQLCVALAIGVLWMTVHDPRWLPLALLAVVPLALSGWLQRRTRVTRRGVLRASLVYGVGWIAYGLSGLLAQIAVTGVRDQTYPLYIAGAACVAWAVGLVVVIAPGGVGVREVVYIWFLSSLYPRAGLQGASVLLRIVTIAAELAVLIAVGLPWVRRLTDPPAPPAAAAPPAASTAEPERR
jgi:glycosyltransferase 2 family protein